MPFILRALDPVHTRLVTNLMAKTLTQLQDGLLSYFDHRISSGPMEGTNTAVIAPRPKIVDDPAGETGV
jgi:transposase